MDQNAAAGADHQGAKPDWYSRHRLAAVTLLLWLLAFALLGILAVLYFKPYQPTAIEGAEYAVMNVVGYFHRQPPIATYAFRY